MAHTITLLTRSQLFSRNNWEQNRWTRETECDRVYLLPNVPAPVNTAVRCARASVLILFLLFSLYETRRRWKSL